VGQAGDYIRKRTEDGMRSLLKGYISRADRIGRPDAIGKQTPDGQYVVLADGTTRKVIKEGIPNKTDAVIKVTSDTVYMPSPYTRHIHVEGGNSVWAILGKYPDGTVFTSYAGFIPRGASQFPVFNLVNLSSLAQYKVPASLLPNTYTIQAHSATTFVGDTFAYDSGFNGMFAAALSPNGRTLVVVRAVWSFFTIADDPFTTTVSDDRQFIYWDIIKDFTVNGVTGEIESSDVIGGSTTYNYTGPRTTGAAIPGSGQFNQFAGDPVIWFDADGAHIDLVGYWASEFDDTDVTIDGGIWVVEGVEASGSQHYYSLEGSAGADYSTMDTENGGFGTSDSAGLFVNRDNPVSFSSSDLLSGGPYPSYRDSNGQTARGYRTDDSKWLFLHPWNTISTDIDDPEVHTIAEQYITDSENCFPAASEWLPKYNAGTTTHSNGFVKTVGTALFQELQMTDLKANQIQKWRFDNDPLSPTYRTMVKTGTVAVKTAPSDMTVVGAEGTDFPTVIMDFVVTS
jgi:hypothetical protein